MVNQLSVAEVFQASFSQIVGYVREPNMCSGGIRTVHRTLQASLLPPNAEVLEVGCNTGFTTLEIASVTSHRVTGLDVNPTSLSFAREKAESHSIENAQFVEGDATAMPFGDDSFDMVFVSNVTSFIEDRDKAVAEYYRVLKPRGVMAAAPIYYHEPPPRALKGSVEQAIGAPIDIWDKEFWVRAFSYPGSQLFFDEDYEYVHQTQEHIAEYANMVIAQEHLKEMSPDVIEALRQRLNYFYSLFNENLRFARYSVLLFRNRPVNPEPILHTVRRID